MRQYFEVYKLHTEYISQQTAEHRRQKVEDVRKRSEYRKAHGLEKSGMFGGWTVKSDDEVMGGGMKEGGDLVVGEGVGRAEEFAGLEGGGRKPVKKWLGIW